MKLIVSYEGYMKPNGVSIYEGDITERCLVQVLENHCYGIDLSGDSIQPPTTKELLEQIASDSDKGGCDFIISIISDQGEIVYAFNRNEEETPTKESKTFEEVEIGDVCIGCDIPDIEGTIVWKGTHEQLKLSPFRILLEDIDDVAEDLSELDYDWVIVETPDYGHMLFNYDCDPSGVIVLK